MFSDRRGRGGDRYDSMVSAVCVYTVVMPGCVCVAP